MDITISTNHGNPDTVLTIVDENDALTVYDAQYYKGEWYGDGILNCGEGEMNMFFTIVDDLCTIHLTDPQHENVEPLTTNLHVEGKLKKLKPHHIYSILHATL